MSPSTELDVSQSSHLDGDQSTISLGASHLDTSSIPPFELKKIVEQTLKLQKQVQNAQKAAHGKILSLQTEVDTLTEENLEKEKKIKTFETKIKQLKKKYDENQGLIAKLKPYKTKCQQLTLQNTELLQIISTQKTKKPKENHTTTHNEEKQQDETVNSGPSSPSNSQNTSNQPPTFNRSDSKHNLRRSDSRTTIDPSSTLKKSTSTGSLTSSIANSLSQSSIVVDFKVFNNALMDFLDAIDHLSIIDSCKVVYSMIISTQDQIVSILDQSTETILDTIYTSHFPNVNPSDPDTCKREQVKVSSFFQTFLKQFRRLEFSRLMEQEKIITDTIAALQTEFPEANIQEEVFVSCIQLILPIITNALLKGYKFKSDQQEELKGKKWDISKYDLLNGGPERGEEVTVVVRPALISAKNGKEIRKPLVCCTLE